MESEYFIFDNIKSTDMDVYIVRMDSGLAKSPFFGGQGIEEKQTHSRITPYHFGTQKEPIQFTIQISPVDKKWTPQLRNKIGRWLIHDVYKPFQTSDDMGKYYYAICTEAPDFELANTLGYLEMVFRTNSAYAWSPVYIEEFNLLDNIAGTIIELENMSNVLKYYYPVVEIKVVEGTSEIKIENLSDGGRLFKFDGLVGNEVISIDNENEIMITANPIRDNIFSKFNRNWLRLVYGVNRLKVTGSCKLKFKLQFPILQ